MRNELEWLDIQSGHMASLYKDFNLAIESLNRAQRVISVIDGAIAHRMTELSKSQSASPTPTPASDKIITSGFTFGDKSEAELKGVDPQLVTCVRLALDFTTQDFMVYDGIRTIKEQEAHVRNGTSKTMKSKHLEGKAVDLVPFIDGIPQWDWDGCYKIALAMDNAATALGIADRITWGGAWDKTLAQLHGEGPDGYKKAVEEYRIRRGGKAFIDGPHFEIKD